MYIVQDLTTERIYSFKVDYQFACGRKGSGEVATDNQIEAATKYNDYAWHFIKISMDEALELSRDFVKTFPASKDLTYQQDSFINWLRVLEKAFEIIDDAELDPPRYLNLITSYFNQDFEKPLIDLSSGEHGEKIKVAFSNAKIARDFLEKGISKLRKIRADANR